MKNVCKIALMLLGISGIGYCQNFIQEPPQLLDAGSFSLKLLEGKGGPYSKVKGDVLNNIKMKIVVKNGKVKKYEYVCSMFVVAPEEYEMFKWYMERLNSERVFKRNMSFALEVLLVLEQDVYQVYRKTGGPN